MSDSFREKWPEMRMKHLELIQNAITRMGANNASLKGYCMTMVAAIIGLAAAVSKEQILLYTMPVVIAFSVLDADYLSLERGFRCHFDEVRKRPMDHEPDFHVMPTSQGDFLKSYRSWSVIGFYGAILAVMIAIYVIMPEVVAAK